MTNNQLLYLCLIGRGCKRQRDIARALGKAYTTAHDALQRLKRRGLVTWVDHQWDTLQLTPAGVEALRGYALIRANGRLRLGRVVRVY